MKYQKEVDFSGAYPRLPTTQSKAKDQIIIKALDCLLLMARFLVIGLGEKPVTLKDKGERYEGRI